MSLRSISDKYTEYFGKVCTSKNLTKSDHSSVFIFPKVQSPPVRFVFEFIVARSDHHKNWSLMLQKPQRAIDWSTVLAENDINIATDKF